MDQSRQLKDGVILTAVYMILMLISGLVPVISVVAVFLLPVPFTVYASRYDWKPAIVMFFAAAALSVLLTSVFGLALAIVMGIGGIMAGIAIRRNLSAYETLSRGTIGFVLGLVLLFVFSQYALQTNLVTEINQMMQQSINASQDMMDEFGLVDLTEKQMDMVTDQLEMLRNLLPAWIAIGSLVLAWISQWVSYKVIDRLDSKALRFPPFRLLNLPVSLIWIYLVALILSLFDLDTSGMVFTAVNNVLMLTGIFMLLQGFSFIFFYAHEKHKSKALPIISIIVTVFLPFIFLFLIRLLGILDIGISLKDRISNDKT
ncbi:YybS family protein [Barrientosiimonas marina]|uniref:YybS family protein n=1 Tax=Lentibacillus kimchii TaxID=1542911 RepID=A0ABW2UTR2_9BACI